MPGFHGTSRLFVAMGVMALGAIAPACLAQEAEEGGPGLSLSAGYTGD